MEMKPLNLKIQNSSIWQMLLFFVCFATLSACGNSDHQRVDEEQQKRIDEAIIKTYLEQEKIADAVRTPSGLYYVVLKSDSTAGRQAAKGNQVQVHYLGKLMSNGQKFDSSYDRGKAFEFTLGAGKVIKGWDEGIALMKEHENFLLIIPSHLGYGRNATGSIPANSVLIFDVDLLSLK